MMPHNETPESIAALRKYYESHQRAAEALTAEKFAAAMADANKAAAANCRCILALAGMTQYVGLRVRYCHECRFHALFWGGMARAIIVGMQSALGELRN